MKKILLLSLVSFNSFALECTGDKVVRLDAPGKTLENATVQDQDGLGSCFANTTSILLQSVLKDNPSISYLNLGLVHAQSQNLSDMTKLNDKMYTNKRTVDGVENAEGNSAIWGGFVCDTIAAVKKRQAEDNKGVLCSSQDVNLEHNYWSTVDNGFHDPQWGQEKALLAASKYMNTYQSKFGYGLEAESKDKKVKNEFLEKRKKADKFRSALLDFVGKKNDAYLLRKCTVPDKENNNKLLLSVLTKAVLSNKDCYDSKFRFKDTPKCKPFQKMGGLYGAEDPNDKTMKAKIYINEETQNKMTSSFASLLSNENSNTTGFENGIKGLFGSLLDKGTKDQKDKFANDIAASISPEDKNALEKEFNRVALKNIDECKAENALAYFQDKDEFLKDAKEDDFLKSCMDLLTRASDIAGVLPKNVFKNLSDFTDFLTDKAGLTYDKAIVSLMAKDCVPDKRISLPESVSCSTASIDLKASDLTTDAPTGEARATIIENRNKMFSKLEAGTGVGLSICTRFWNEDNFDLHKDPSADKVKNCAESGAHGAHAVTMIGYRCQAGKVQYLTQNSWGTSWDPKFGTVETVKGRAWVDEDRLFKNIYQVDYISK